MIDKTLFIKKANSDIILVQIYVDASFFVLPKIVYVRNLWLPCKVSLKCP